MLSPLVVQESYKEHCMPFSIRGTLYMYIASSLHDFVLNRMPWPGQCGDVSYDPMWLRLHDNNNA